MKRIIQCTILMLAVVLLCVNINVLAENAESETALEFLAAEKMAALGIIQMPETTEKLNEYVTRGEMAEILAAYLDLTYEVYGATETPFVDISIYDENVGLYNMLYEFGYIQGDTSGKFNPDRNMTCNEAVKFTVTAMGYAFFAEKNGGYPDGFINVAVKNGLLKGISVSPDGYITMKDLCRMLEASLDADSVEESFLKGDGTVEVKLNTEVCVLEKIHGISKVRGIVTGNENTRLGAADSKDIGRYDIEIENVLYHTNEKEYAHLLGFKVDAYVRENRNGDSEAVYLEKTPSNSLLKIDADFIRKESCTNNKIVYELNNKYKDVSLDKSGIAVILNGKYYSGSNITQILPEEGYIECIDNSGDSKADVLFIYSSRNFVVGSIDNTTGKLTEKYTSEKITIDSREDEVRVYDVNKAPAAFSEIKPGDVLTIFESEDLGGYRLIALYKCGEAVTLTVSAIENEEEYFIGDKSYKLAANVCRLIASGKMKLPDAGEDITFVTDINGKIADFSVHGVSQMLYAVVAARSDKYKLKDGLQIKLFNQNGEWVKAKAADKIKIDGEKYSVNSATDFGICALLIPVGDVVRYKLTDGKITHIDTINPDKGNNTAVEDMGNLNLIASGTQFVSRDGICYKYGSNGIDSEADADNFILSANTVVFRIPEKSELSDESLYSVSNSIGGNYFSDWTPQGEGSVKIKEGYCAYNTKSEDIEIAGCVLLKGCEETGAGINYYSRFCVITDIRTAIDENGDASPMLYYSQGNGVVSNPVAEKVFYSIGNSIWSAQRECNFYEIKLRKGDIIQLGFNGDTINYINVVYRIDQTSGDKGWAWVIYPMQVSGFDLERGAICARVNNVNNSVSVLRYYLGTDKATAKFYNICVPSYIPVIIYREEENTVETGSLTSIMEDDLVIIKSSYGTNADQVIVMR